MKLLNLSSLAIIFMAASCAPQPAFAVDEGDVMLCDKIGLAARATMVARQYGKPMKEQIETARESGAMHLTEMIVDAYSYPVVKGEREKYYSSYKFEHLYYQSCMNFMVKRRANYLLPL